MNTAYVALGANIGDPAATVLAAFAALANLPESRVAHCSSLYRTAPVGHRTSRNSSTPPPRWKPRWPPESLLDALLDLEARFGASAPTATGRAPSTSTCCSTTNRTRTAAPDPAPPAPAPARLRPPPARRNRAGQLPGCRRGAASFAAWLPAVANQTFAWYRAPQLKSPWWIAALISGPANCSRSGHPK
jgi:2-amino-4-hydroxy-6-hydroxymethyldihydropteridine diphosphokinase